MRPLQPHFRLTLLAFLPINRFVDASNVVLQRLHQFRLTGEECQPCQRIPHDAVGFFDNFDGKCQVVMALQLTPPDKRPAVAHVAAHELGAAAYAIKAVRAAASEGERDVAGRRECKWQREQLPSEIRELVLDDQRLRNELCWFVFTC